MSAVRTWCAHLIVLVGRELRQFMRDRVGFGLTLIAPVLAAVVASVSLGAPPKVDALIVVVGAVDVHSVGSDLGALATSLSSGQGALHWQGAPDEATARRMVVDGKAAAALILPGKNDTAVRVVVNRNTPIPAALATTAARTLAAHLEAQRFLSTTRTAAAPVAPIKQALSVEVATLEGHVLNGAELYGPAVATFFLFLGAGFVARSLQAEREQGTAARLRVIPVGSATIISAKLAMMVIMGAAEFATVLTFMTLFFGAQWGNPIALVEIVGALTLAVGALAIMVASFAKTVFMANSLQMLVALALGALGGSLVPLQNLPNGARWVAGLTPNGVAIRTMRDVAAGQRGPAGVTGPVLAILAFALLTACIGFVNGRRVVTAT